MTIVDLPYGSDYHLTHFRDQSLRGQSIFQDDFPRYYPLFDTMPCTSQRDRASPLLAGTGNFTYPTRNFALSVTAISGEPVISAGFLVSPQGTDYIFTALGVWRIVSEDSWKIDPSLSC